MFAADLIGGGLGQRKMEQGAERTGGCSAVVATGVAKAERPEILLLVDRVPECFEQLAELFRVVCLQAGQGGIETVEGVERRSALARGRKYGHVPCDHPWGGWRSQPWWWAVCPGALAVTAMLRVNENVHAPLFCVTDVFDIASGDLSLPGKVR